MKQIKKYLLIVLIALGMSSLAQNWNIINPDYTYNYAVNDVYDVSSYVLSTEGNNTVFYMNEIVLPCDTCQGAISGALMIHQSTFMQHKIEKIDNLYWFNGHRSFVIFPYAELGDTWLFDTLNNITAELVLETTETIIGGVDDATKHIKLSNNDSIVLSENHGIVRFDISGKSYRLIGVETPTDSIGYVVPKFRDFYNFEVGDIFQYKKIIPPSEASQGQDPTHYTFSRNTILSKTFSGDSIIYSVRKNIKSYFHQHSSGIPYEYTYGYEYDTVVEPVVVIDSLTHMCNLYNRESLKVCTNSFSPEGVFYEEVRVKKDDNGLIIKQYGNSYDAPRYILSSEYPNIMVIDPYQLFYARQVYTQGLGLTSYELYDERLVYLIGYVKNGDTTGTVYDDDFYTSTGNLKNQSDIHIYPNPAKEKVYIQNLSADVSKIEIYDITGKLVNDFHTNKGNTFMQIDISKFRRGVYFIKIGTLVHKLIKP